MKIRCTKRPYRHVPAYILSITLSIMGAIGQECSTQGQTRLHGKQRLTKLYGICTICA